MNVRHNLLAKAWISTLLGPIGARLMGGASTNTITLGLLVAIVLEVYAIVSFYKANSAGWSVLGIVIASMALVGVLLASFFAPTVLVRTSQ